MAGNREAGGFVNSTVNVADPVAGWGGTHFWWPSFLWLIFTGLGAMAPSAPQIWYWSNWISTNRFHQIFLVVDLMAVGFVEFLVLTEIPMMIKISPSNTYSSDNFKISDDSCSLLFNKHFYFLRSKHKLCFLDSMYKLQSKRLVTMSASL